MSDKFKIPPTFRIYSVDYMFFFITVSKLIKMPQTEHDTGVARYQVTSMDREANRCT